MFLPETNPIWIVNRNILDFFRYHYLFYWIVLKDKKGGIWFFFHDLNIVMVKFGVMEEVAVYIYWWGRKLSLSLSRDLNDTLSCFGSKLKLISFVAQLILAFQLPQVSF